MRIELIEEFLVFARWMNFSKAAAELHLAQPNLSKHMAELEREIGVPLIDRETNGKNHPTLTAAGKYFFEAMSSLHVDYSEVLSRCREIHRNEPQPLRFLELWGGHAMNKLYPIVERYLLEHPYSEVNFFPLQQGFPLQLLEDGSYDIVFWCVCGDASIYQEEIDARGMIGFPFLAEPPVLWFQKENQRVADLMDFQLENLLQVPILESQGKTFDYVVSAYERRCKDFGFTPRIRFTQLMDNTPSNIFLSNLRDGALLTTYGMVDDPRLGTRSDLSYRIVDDQRIVITMFLVGLAENEGAVDFLRFAQAAEHQSGSPCA